MKKIIIKVYGNIIIHTNEEERLTDYKNIVYVSNCINMPCYKSTYRINNLHLKDDITIKGNLLIDKLSISKNIKIEILCAGTIGYYKDEKYYKTLNLYFN